MSWRMLPIFPACPNDEVWTYLIGHADQADAAGSRSLGQWQGPDMPAWSSERLLLQLGLKRQESTRQKGKCIQQRVLLTIL